MNYLTVAFLLKKIHSSLLICNQFCLECSGEWLFYRQIRDSHKKSETKRINKILKRWDKMLKVRLLLMKEQVYRQCQRNPTSRLLQISHKLKNDNDVTVCWNDVIVNFFSCSFVSLVKFSYWSMFHVNIITGSSVMTIFFYKGLTRNPEIGNTLVWVFPNI